MKKKQQLVFRNGVAGKDFQSIVKEYPVCTVTIEEGEPKKRSLDANALQHVWYQEIADYTGHSKTEIEGYCKVEFGLPILRHNVESESEKIPAFMIKQTFEHPKIKYDIQDYERKIEIALKTPCTSMMSKRQHKNYMDELQKHYAPGLILEAR